MSQFVVITSINATTEALRKHAQVGARKLVVVADRKTPTISLEGSVKVLDMKWQASMDYSFLNKCPFDHYSRKNIGYIYAIKEGASSILDTDDDNIPYEEMYSQFDVEGKTCETAFAPKFVNIYRMFTHEQVWPRGFPLSKIRDTHPIETRQDVAKEVVLVQGLADGDTDVDAIYRLVLGSSVTFNARSPVLLDEGTYCPINSQSTMWLKEAFVYLYLPVTVSFRMTDILRGYIAQSGVAAMGKRVAFVGPVVFQKRNAHNILKDFADEAEMYLTVERIVSNIEANKLKGVPAVDIRKIYENLEKDGYVGNNEIECLEAWLSDLDVL